MTADPATSPERLHALDALRGIALLLGIVLHATLSFFPVQVWIIADSAPSPAMSGLFFVIHLFRMTAFFLIAGFFAHLLLHRLGTRGFVKDRLKRIAGPLFAFWPVVFAAIVVVAIWAAWVSHGGAFPEDPPPPPEFGIRSFPLTHLWFLWVLLILYAVLLAGRAVAAAIDRAGVLRRFADAAVRLLVAPWGLPLLALPLALALHAMPGWVGWFAIPTPDQSLIPNLPAFTGYGTAFLIGYLLRRQPGLLRDVERRWPVHLALGAALAAIAMHLAGGAAPTLAPTPEGTEKMIQAGIMALAVFATAFAALALSLRFLSAHRPALRYLSDSSYWIYIVHLPLVMAAQVWLAPLGWAWPIKFAAIVAGTSGLALLSYKLLVRNGFLGAFLNGRRRPPAKRRGAVVAAAE